MDSNPVAGEAVEEEVDAEREEEEEDGDEEAEDGEETEGGVVVQLLLQDRTAGLMEGTGTGTEYIETRN